MNGRIGSRWCRAWPWAVALTAAALLRGGLLVTQRERLADDSDGYRALTANRERDSEAMEKERRADPDGYRRLAANLLEYGTYGLPSADPAAGRLSIRPTAYRPPVYPLLLALAGSCAGLGPLGIGMLHFVLGVGTVGLVYVLSRQWRLGRWGLAAALLVACDPILLYWSTRVMTETLATFLGVAALVCLSRLSGKPTLSMAALAGAVLSLASLCRPTFLPWLALAAGMLLLAPGRGGRRVAPAIAFVLAAAATLVPWIVRNQRALGHPIIATTHGGYTLLLGNNPEFYAFVRTADWGDVWKSDAFDKRCDDIKLQFGHDEIQVDRWAYRCAWTSIRNDWTGFAHACLVRVGRLWGLVPHQVARSESTLRCLARWLVGLWYAAVYGLAIFGAWSLGKRLWRVPWLWGILLCLAFTAMHTVYWSNLRMRAPLMPVVCLAAAAGIRRLFEPSVGPMPAASGVSTPGPSNAGEP